MTDPFALIAERQSQVADEINDLSHRIALLKAELDQLDEASALLSRLANAKAASLGNERWAAMHIEETPPIAERDALSHKPLGTPPVTEMIAEALAVAHSAGSPGLSPSGVLSWIRQKYWPAAEVANIGPIAWRMWKRGKLGKDGQVYFRFDRERLYPYPESDEAPSFEKEEAS